MPVLVIFIRALVIIAYGTKAQQKEGDVCVTSDGVSGICKLPESCPAVYQAMLNGKLPDTLCGSSPEFEPIICCNGVSNAHNPTTMVTTTTTEEWTTGPQVSTTEISRANLNPGDLAKIKCSKYAKSVYQMEVPPTMKTIRKAVNTSVCGMGSQKLIVGGKIAASREFPHMAAVGFNAPGNRINWDCGGTLVSERFVLTAAHCTLSIDNKKPAWIRVGDLNLVKTNDDARPQHRAIIDWICHPRYKLPSSYHDIALLKMDKAVTLDAYVRPACLSTIRGPEGTNTVATGWGLIRRTDEKGSNDLLKVTLPIVPFIRCNDSFGGDDLRLKNGIVDDWQICAGAEGKDTCQGDSGGPLVVFTSSEYCMYDVVGITSIGKACGKSAPGVYTRVYNYLPWIESVVW